MYFFLNTLEMMTMNEEHEIPALTFCKSLILLGISPTEFGGIATAIMGLPLVWNINSQICIQFRSQWAVITS